MLSFRPPLTAVLARRFAASRRAGSAIEFALCGPALFFFLLAIVNLGDLGLVLGVLQHGVEGAARQASVQAAANLAGVGSNTTCPATSDVQAYFTALTAPTLNSNYVTLSYGSGSPWVIADATLPGSYIVLTATYTWKPIGLSHVVSGINLSLTSAAFVMGTSASVTC